jgi:hypothetical protein
MVPAARATLNFRKRERRQLAVAYPYFPSKQSLLLVFGGIRFIAFVGASL